MFKRILVCGGLFFVAFARMGPSGLAQIISTYVGPTLPVNGTQAITQDIGAPSSVAADGGGGFYFTSQNRVYRVAADGTLSLIAGSLYASAGYSGDGGAATSAELNSPDGVAVDAVGNLYIADSGNNRIRKVTAGGVISTVAGNGGGGY